MSDLPSPTALSNDFAESTTREQRATDLYHDIDPGFIHWRKCLSLIGPKGRALFKEYSATTDDHFGRVTDGHLLVEIVLTLLNKGQVMTLSEALRDPVDGRLFCSTKLIKGDRRFWKATRPTNRIVPAIPTKRKVILEYGKEHIVSDTLRSELSHGENRLSIIGHIRHVATDRIVVHPLIIGSPWLEHPRNKHRGLDTAWLMWHGLPWFEIFCGDIDEFSSVGPFAAPSPDQWQPVMQTLSETAVKTAFASLLGETASKDWAGEQHDHYSAHVHLGARRVTCAFVFKGPSRFKPMTPAMLGKNADQIVRLATSSANLLIVQHCHEITDAVRATLRAFAVAPHNPRRYCLIDGRDTYRILKVYRKL